MSQSNPQIPWRAIVYAKQTFGVTDNPQNPPIATFTFGAESALGLPDFVSWEGRVFANEKLGGFGQPMIAFYEVQPTAVEMNKVGGP